MANYIIPTNPVYNASIRKLEDSDPASASTIFNPLIQQLIENTHAIKKGMPDWQEVSLSEFADMDSLITPSLVDVRYNSALSEVKVHFKPISIEAMRNTGDVIGIVKADYKPAFTQYGTCVIKSSSDVCIRSVEINSEGKITILNDGETAAAIDNLFSLDLSYIVGTAAE